MSLLKGEHYRFRRQPGLVSDPDEIVMTSEWRLSAEAPTSPLLSRMVEDFRRFCAECLDLDLGEMTPAHSVETRRVSWRLTGSESSSPDFDRQDPKIEAFALTVTDAGVEISAEYERGLLQGTHYLEWLMADRGGPVLKRGSLSREPAFMPRISNGVFIPCLQTPLSFGDFPDEYLSLMSHYGINGIHFTLDLWKVFQSKTLPELNSPGVAEDIAALRQLAQRLSKFGIDLYPVLITLPLMESHPVFRNHPDARGGRVELFLDGISGKPWHNLCSSSGKVLAAYAEAVENLFLSIPEMAGAIMAIGGESFYHCFTRPDEAAPGDANCPHCRGKSPSSEIAHLVNAITEAIKKTGSHKALYAWPYSAFVWSLNDPFQLEWIRHLKADVSVINNYDCDDEDASTASRVHFFDYNIKCLGPSDTFARQKEQLREQRRPIFAKTETNTTPDAFSLPYLPLHFRWLARFSSMRELGVAGFIGQWRFFGMNASLPEELLYKITWSDLPPVEHLKTICRRDFDLKEPEISEILHAWRLMSESWESFPYSALTSGERECYMRGPFYLGAAHPLIFDAQKTYALPRSFYQVRGDLGELATSEEIEEVEKLAKPRYVSDLLLTFPFGVERYLELLKNCRTKWTEGMTLLRRLLKPASQRAQMELDISEALDSHLRTLENVVRFYQARDILQNSASTPEEFQARLEILRNILNDEIANAERMRPILQRDIRIGYGYCYGPMYDAAMVEAKISQCRTVRDVELPRFRKIIRFHVWQQSP